MQFLIIEEIVRVANNNNAGLREEFFYIIMIHDARIPVTSKATTNNSYCS